MKISKFKKAIFISIFTAFTAGNIFCQTSSDGWIDSGDENYEEELEENTTEDFEQSEEGTLFRFKHVEGDCSKIICTVNEDVYLNSQFINRAVITNRITNRVTKVDEDGNGTLEASFMTSENNTGRGGRSVQWENEFFSRLERSPKGEYTISDEYFMPTVRDVPIFPEEPVVPGDKWQAKGHEAHDLRQGFGIEKPYKVPFTANYEYVRDEMSENGKLLNLIICSYKMNFENPYTPDSYQSYSSIPYITNGKSVQYIWWDNEKGTIDHYKEEFEINITTFSMDYVKFKGTSHAEVTEFQREGTEENLKKIENRIRELDLKDVSVQKGERGLTINIENIQFLPDSAVLLESEKTKLTEIGKLLKATRNDLLITGHCAKRGSVKSQMTLSTERAQTVADFLKEQKVRKANQLYIEGKGAKQPVASNSTEAGRARNRRVEITIMDR